MRSRISAKLPGDMFSSVIFIEALRTLLLKKYTLLLHCYIALIQAHLFAGSSSFLLRALGQWRRMIMTR